jgi:hypothetical protein
MQGWFSSSLRRVVLGVEEKGWKSSSFCAAQSIIDLFAEKDEDGAVHLRDREWDQACDD